VHLKVEATEVVMCGLCGVFGVLAIGEEEGAVIDVECCVCEESFAFC